MRLVFETAGSDGSGLDDNFNDLDEDGESRDLVIHSEESNDDDDDEARPPTSASGAVSVTAGNGEMMLKKNPKSAIHPSSSKSSAHGGDFSSDDGEQGIDSPSKSVDDGNSDYAECAVGSKLGKGNGEDSNGHGPKTQGGNNNQQQPLKCDQCDYETFSFALLQTHQRGHENDPKKPFQCDICNMKFSNGANMRRHRVRHTGVKPFECRVCQKRFFRKDHLAEHMTTHNKKLPFHCPVCNKGFQRQIAMRAHFQNEHVGNAEGQKTCGLCGYNAGSLKGLGVHMAKKHGIDLDDPSPAAAAAAAAAAHLVASGHGFHESPLMHSLHFGAVNMDQQQSCPPSPTPPMGLLPSHFLAPQVEISLAQPPSPSNAQSLMEVRDCSSPSPPPPTSTSGSFIKSALVTALAINMHGANGHPKGSLQKLSPKSTGSCGSSSGSSMSDHSEDEPRLTIDTGEYPTLYSIKREHTDSSDGISPPQKRFCGAESLKKRFLSRLDGNDAVAPNSSTNAANADSNNNTNGEYRDNDDDTNQTTNGEGSRSPSPGATNLIKVSPLKSLLRHQQFQSNGQQNTDPFHPNHPSLPVGFFPAKFGHQCVFCSIVFPDQTLYFLHKGFHSEGNPWKCNICSEQYANVYEFNAHLLSKSHQ